MQELTLEEQYFRILEDAVLENQKETAFILGLDDIATEELTSLIVKNQLTREVFTNTLKLWLTEDEIVKSMTLIVKHKDISDRLVDGIGKNADWDVLEELNFKRFELVAELDEIIGKYGEQFEDKTRQVVSNFYDFYKDDIVRMVEESEKRRGVV